MRAIRLEQTASPEPHRRPGKRDGNGMTRAVDTRGPDEPAEELRILLAEDNAVNQKVTATVLRRRGHQVDVVDNGQLAVEAVRERAYDLVLMDVSMPVMDGLTATREIRALSGAGSLPILALTAHALDEERERGIEAGMNAYLTKPIRGRQLIEAVERWARESGHPPAASDGGAHGEDRPEAGSTADGGGADRKDRPEDGSSADGGGRNPGSPPGGDDDPPEAAPPPADLESLREALAAVGADSALEDILGAYVADAPTRIEAVVDAVEDGDAEAIARAAHAYKSAAGHVGARRLHGLLKAMEGIARDGDVEESRALLEETRAEHDRVFAWLEARKGGGTGS